MIAAETKQKLTSSRRDKYKKCPKAHYYAYELGIRREDEGEALRIGSGVHEGLDVLAQTGDRELAINAVRDFYARCPVYVDRDKWLAEEQIAMALVLGYEWRWRNAKLKVVATEQSFDIPIVNPGTDRPSRTFTQSGKMDKIVKDEANDLALMEHKTTSDDISPDARYWKRLDLNSQITSYYHAARQIGHDVSYIIYDVIRKPTTRPNLINEVDENGKKIVLDENGERVFKKDGTPRESGDTAKGYTLQRRRETPKEYGERLMKDIMADPDKYYARKPVHRLDTDMEEFAIELWRDAKRIREDQIADVWPKNDTACDRPYPCEYFNLCTSGWKGLEDGIPEGYKVLQDKHPELS